MGAEPAAGTTTQRRKWIRAFVLLFLLSLFGTASYDLAVAGAPRRLPGLADGVAELLRQLHGPPNAGLFAPPALLYWQVSVCVAAKDAPRRRWSSDRCLTTPYQSVEGPLEEVAARSVARPTRDFRFAELLISSEQRPLLAEAFADFAARESSSADTRTELWMHAANLGKGAPEPLQLWHVPIVPAR